MNKFGSSDPQLLHEIDITEAYPLDIIARVNKWNIDAGRTHNVFNVRQMAFYTGMQCEELGEKLDALGLAGIANYLHLVGNELKEGTWDNYLQRECESPEAREAILDADCDITVVTIGSAQGQGANFHGAMAAVINANERKRQPDGKLLKNEHGKIQKPEGWTPPDLTPYLCKE